MRTPVSSDLEEMGAIDYLIVEFPGNKMTGEGFGILIDLVDRGIIRILDLAFFEKADDGSVSRREDRRLGRPVDST